MLWQDRAGKRFQLKAKEAFHDFVRLAIDQRNHLAQELFWRPALRTQIEWCRKGWFNLWFIHSCYWLSETCDCNHPTCIKFDWPTSYANPLNQHAESPEKGNSQRCKETWQNPNWNSAPAVNLARGVSFVEVIPAHCCSSRRTTQEDLVATQ